MAYSARRPRTWPLAVAPRDGLGPRPTREFRRVLVKRGFVELPGPNFGGRNENESARTIVEGRRGTRPHRIRFAPGVARSSSDRLAAGSRGCDQWRIQHGDQELGPWRWHLGTAWDPGRLGNFDASWSNEGL